MVQAPTDAEAEKVANFIHGEVRTETPGLSLPKGGGAIRGIGEKFAPNPVTGTGSMSVPLAISPGRSAFGPQLSLAYDSGAGNGPFGVGWSLSLPAVTRKADKGLPQYRDGEESDVFLLPGEIFERSGNLHVVGVAGEFGGVFEDALALPPDVVLIDTALPMGCPWSGSSSSADCTGRRSGPGRAGGGRRMGGIRRRRLHSAFGGPQRNGGHFRRLRCDKGSFRFLRPKASSSTREDIPVK